MDALVVGEFGMEGCGHGSSLPNRDRVVSFGGDDFNVGADAFDFRGADENHFQRRTGKPALADRTIDLASVGVAADADIERAQAGLFWILHFARQQDRAGAGAEGWFQAHELLQLFEAFFSEQFQESARLASGDDQTVDAVELLGLFDEHNLSAQLFEPATMGIEIALQSQDPDLHRDLILPEAGFPAGPLQRPTSGGRGGWPERGDRQRYCNAQRDLDETVDSYDPG